MKRTVFAALLVNLLAVYGVSAQTKDVPVTSVLADSDEAVAPALQITSDGGGAYTNIARTLESVIQPVGDWEMDTGIFMSKPSNRKVYLAFTQPVPGSGPSGGPVAPLSRDYVTRFLAQCWSVGNSLFTIPVGQQVACPMVIRFNDAVGDAYRIALNPTTKPGTDDVTVACVGGDAAGQCVRWRITPSGTYAGADGVPLRASVGRLVKLVTKKGLTTEVVQGDFQFSFSIGVAQ